MKKKLKPQPEKQEEEKVLSLKRVGVAVALFAVLIFGTIMSLSYVSNVLVGYADQITGGENDSIPEHVRLPKAEDKDTLLKVAQDQIQNLSKQDFTVVGNVLDFLLELQASDKGIEKVICPQICN